MGNPSHYTPQPVSPIAMSRGPRVWVRHAVPPRRGASPINHHDDVFLREKRRLDPVWPFIKLRSPGKGPRRGHEASHHATILELVPIGVYVV
jgi:hypothetical protein